MSQKLTAAAVANAKPRLAEYKLTDGNSMYLRVRTSGARSWWYRYRTPAGKQKAFCLGPYPEVSLKRARELLVDARRVTSGGGNPLRERRTRAQNTFEMVAREWIGKKKPNWSAIYLAQVQRTLDRNVFPRFGATRIAELSAADLLQVIEEVAERTLPPGKKQRREHGAVTVALFIRQLCSQIMKYAVARRLAERDVAADLRAAVVRRNVRNHPGLRAEELPDFIAALAKYGASPHISASTVIAIELLLLTFVRTGELRLAQWGEFDLDGALWTIPAARMKMDREHLVPLCPRALELLRELKAQGTGSPWLFPNRRDHARPMSATTINRALEYMGYGGRLSGHGFRSTASTLLHELGFSPPWIEKQLAHESRNRVAAAYNKAQYLEQRREMMGAWSDFVHGENAGSSKILPFRNAA